MAFGDSGCKLMVLRLRFFSWMAKRISLSTNKALLTVLPALHSLPWAYDSQPSDYHLNISFFQRAGRCSFRCRRAYGFSRVRRPGCRGSSQACRSSWPLLCWSLPLANHPGRCVAVRICHSQPKEARIIEMNTTCVRSIAGSVNVLQKNQTLDCKIVSPCNYCNFL